MKTILTKIKALSLILVFCFASSQVVTAETHWLDFNPYAFSTEFFRVNNIKRGSCGAAAVVLVESHITLQARIASDAVKNKNSQMLLDPTKSMRPYLSGMYYISSIDGIGTRLQQDGYKVNWLGTSNRPDCGKEHFRRAREETLGDHSI